MRLLSTVSPQSVNTRISCGYLIFKSLAISLETGWLQEFFLRTKETTGFLYQPVGPVKRKLDTSWKLGVCSLKVSDSLNLLNKVLKIWGRCALDISASETRYWFPLYFSSFTETWWENTSLVSHCSGAWIGMIFHSTPSDRNASSLYASFPPTSLHVKNRVFLRTSRAVQW